MWEIDQSLAEIETAFRTRCSLIELRTGARAPVERLEAEALRVWDSVDGIRRNEILQSIRGLESALQTRPLYRDTRLDVPEAKTVQEGLLLRLRALLHHLAPNHERPPDDF